MKLNTYLCFFLWITALKGGAASIAYYHTENYYGRSSNPFFGNASIQTAYLEDFEQQNLADYPYNYLTTPYAQGWNGAVVDSLSSGVREDYSATDPDGGLGYRWTDSIRTPETEKLPLGIHFDFAPDAGGAFPEYVGAALRGMTGTSGDFNLIFVYDSKGIEVTEGLWQIGKPAPGLPVEDRFSNFHGIYVPGGISRIHFRDFREVDHLTYGYAIPEPSAVGLAMGSVFWLMRRQRTCGLSL